MNMAHQLISTKIIEEYHNLEELREREAEEAWESDEDSSLGSGSNLDEVADLDPPVISPPSDAPVAANPAEPEKTPDVATTESVPAKIPTQENVAEKVEEEVKKEVEAPA